MAIYKLLHLDFLSYSWSFGKYFKHIFQIINIREDIQKKKLYKEWNWYHLPYPPPPLLKEWKTKEWNIGMFETPLPPH